LEIASKNATIASGRGKGQGPIAGSMISALIAGFPDSAASDQLYGQRLTFGNTSSPIVRQAAVHNVRTGTPNVFTVEFSTV